MADVRHTAFDCIDRLNTLQTVDALLDELRIAGGNFGFDNFAISGIPLPGEDLGPYLMMRDCSDEWITRYAVNNYVHVDPVIRHLQQTAMPFTWDEVPTNLFDEPGRRVMNEAHDFGIKQGLAVPIYTAHGFQALVSFCGSSLDINRDRRAALHLIAIYAHGRVRSLLQPKTLQEPVARLSVRELDCLKWSAAGKTAWETSVILSLSEKTVEKYLATAVRKLGAVNKVQSIAIAIRQKILD